MTHRRSVALLVLLWAAALIPAHSFAQQEEQPVGKRMVVNRIVRSYPQLARTMNLKGTVRIEALVARIGVVQPVSVKAGHPALLQSAENPGQNWRRDPTSHAT